jgi:hypothetical protein
MGASCSKHGDKKCIQTMVGKRENKRPLEREQHTIKTALEVLECESIQLSHYKFLGTALVNTVINIRFSDVRMIS